LKGNLALFPDILYASAGNNIWNVLFGHRFDRSEHDTPRLLCRSALMFQRANDTTGGAIFQRPFLKYFGNMFGYKNHIKASNTMINMVKVSLSNNYNRNSNDIKFQLPNVHLNYYMYITMLKSYVFKISNLNNVTIYLLICLSEYLS